MAREDHLLRFRRMTNEQLEAKRAQLEAQDSIFQAQNMGSKGFTKDLRLLQDQLNAIAYVLSERGYSIPTEAVRNNAGAGSVDFSRMQP